MKKLMLAAAFAAFAGSAVADLSGDVTMASDYRFRGISQTDEDMALQGSMRYDSDLGIYVGAWASMIDFSDDAGNMEIDYSLGFTDNLTDTITYDVGGVYYQYPNADGGTDYDFYEVYGALGTDIKGADLEFKISYSPDYTGSTGKAVYLEGNGGVEITDGFNLVAHYGYQTIDDGDKFFSDSEDNYMDYSVGVEKDIDKLTFGVYYIGNNLDDGDSCAGSGVCDSTVMASISLGL